MSTSADEIVMAFVGRMGSGKTLNMTKWAIIFAQLSNRQIYANYKINHPQAHYFKSYKELNDVHNAIICYDEISVDHDSRSWDSKGQQQFTHWFLQTRKLHCSFFYTAQRVNSLEKRIRENTLYLIKCTKKIVANRPNFYEDLFDTQEGFEMAIHLKKFVLTTPQLIYRFYNTDEIIKDNFYAKPTTNYRKKQYTYRKQKTEEEEE